ncbi:hypothetical protein CspeluHIS016_0504160 [Cutaneotrichosporon spelunceum]|uniref:AMP binding protein n=1 Tax=Cutaneotrichosporon spelunceum TaxID=1672016 RepID=A0AAD3TXN3_9TREE|nr:hypothetical protein CspeluHIS016_0504160 [Cutaneotrichosporon spelunceum]
MQPKIYESDYPEVFLPSMSIFHYLMPDGPGISPLPHFDPSLPCVIEAATGRTVSRGEMENTALRLGQGLRDAGMRRGDVVNLFAPNSIEFAFATWGTIAAGCTITPANVAYEPRELAHQVNDSGASFFFVAPSHLPVFERARALFKRPVPDSRIVLCCDVGPGARGSAPDKYRSLHELLGARAPAERFETEPMATAFMFYSSGTTGLPKGVETTHYNQTTQMQTAGAHIEQFTTQDRILAFLPMSHMYGAMMFLLIPLRFGCASVLLPQFEEIAVYKAIQEYKITVAPVVPPVLVLWASSPHLKKYDLSSLRSLLSAAAVLSPDVVRQLYKILPVPICDGYGMTETSPAIIVKDNRMSTPDRIGWMGRLLPSYQARLVCEDGTDAPVGTPGELWVRGPNVMKGYRGRTGDILPGGWFQTGDLLVMDKQGWFRIVDRVKELIKYKGLQVAPAELENVLLQHHHIVDAGVVGVEDEKQATELPRAYVVVDPKKAAELKTDRDRHRFAREIAEWAAKRTAQHKRLRGGVVITDVIPKSPSGKILRRLLRERAVTEWASERQGKL